MHGGKHVHYPSVFTHFIPGVLVGAVMGLLFGATIIAGIAQTALQRYWEDNRITNTPQSACVGIEGIRTLSETTPTGGAYTSVILGGQEQSTVLTAPLARVRTVSTATPYRILLTLVADESQYEAFPATSVYIIDGCAMTMEHMLGNGEADMRILAASPQGTLLAFTRHSGQSFLVMQVEDRAVVGEQVSSGVLFGNEAVFAGDDSAVATALGIWDLRTNTWHAFGGSPRMLPPWGLQTFAEYSAQFEYIL